MSHPEASNSEIPAPPSRHPEGYPERLGAEVLLRDGSLGRLVGARSDSWCVLRGGHLPRRFQVPVDQPGTWDEVHRRWVLDVTLLDALAWPDPGPHEPLTRSILRLVTSPLWAPGAVFQRLWGRRRQHFQQNLVTSLRARSRLQEP